MSWLPTLMTTTPEEGYELAIKLSRVAIKKTQPNNDVREKLRPVYENDSDALISVSHVVAVNFQTISAANNYWRE
ncbi:MULTISPECIES: hexameric tyrosine-coordinated heme protein [unclassified Lentilitoribacter]|uniref:hexameric tyrosine-coordinated heme protein n=1 Tax=unclassified Lentilitoribacter TaxID=2647570 RepID=UPI0013A6FDCE|nr:hexameric tyrosine-coordinated heme protein [Lentilitoribacter sp. Alg239-R112]